MRNKCFSVEIATILVDFTRDDAADSRPPLVAVDSAWRSHNPTLAGHLDGACSSTISHEYSAANGPEAIKQAIAIINAELADRGSAHSVKDSGSGYRPGGQGQGATEQIIHNSQPYSDPITVNGTKGVAYINIVLRVEKRKEVPCDGIA